MAAFVARLAELGHVQDKNVDIEPRFAGGDPARPPALARELLEQKVDVVFAPNTSGALALQNLSYNCALIFVSGDPVKAGLGSSLARPGRNATGLTEGRA